MRRNVDLFLTLFLIQLALLLTLSPLANSPLRAVVGLPFVLLLPGYALSALIFPPERLTTAERLTLSLGLSIAQDIVLGFLLNWTPWGLSEYTWAVALAAITALSALFALIRRFMLPPTLATRDGSSPNLRSHMLFGTAALVMLLALFVAHEGALMQPTPGFTQLWMLPTTHDGREAVNVGVSNQGSTELTYRLVLLSNDVKLYEWPSVQLQAGERWDATLVFETGRPANGKLRAQLYRLDAPNTVYRYVEW